MRKHFFSLCVWASLMCLLLVVGQGCNIPFFGGSAGAMLPPPDGIDPDHPNIERTTKIIDYSGVKSVRIELFSGHIIVIQDAAATQATLKITKTINQGGLSNDRLKELLTQTDLTTNRSFVDETRLDVEAALAEGLSDKDIVFDIRLVVPVGADFEVLVDDGPVEIRGLTGNVEVMTHDGEIMVAKVKGNVSVQTTGALISVGDVTGNVLATTTEADIELQVSPAASDRISAETTTGTIRINAGKNTAASLRLISDEGAVAANLKGFQVTDISVGKGFLQGVLNGGGAQIEATTTTGDIEFQGL